MAKSKFEPDAAEERGLIRRYQQDECRDFRFASETQWLLPSGFGHYSMGTLSGLNTHDSHGLFHFDSPANHGFVALLASVDLVLEVEGKSFELSTNQFGERVHPEGYQHLEAVEVGDEIRWRYRVGRYRLEVTLSWNDRAQLELRYHNRSSEPVEISLRPMVLHRYPQKLFTESGKYPSALTFKQDQTLILDQDFETSISHPRAKRIAVQGWYLRRSYRDVGRSDDLYCPCELRYLLKSEQSEAITVSAGIIEQLPSKLPARSHTPYIGSQAKAIWARFPSPVHDARLAYMSFPGLLELELEQIDVLQQYLKLGTPQIASVEREADPHGLDYDLWWINACYELLQRAWDDDFARQVSQSCERILEGDRQQTHHRVIGEDGMVGHASDSPNLTWMSTREEDWEWVPRHGKPIETNALLVNAWWIHVWLLEQLSMDSRKASKKAQKLEETFEATFWNEKSGFYLDTADPADATLRPNQLIALGLPMGSFRADRAKKVYDRARMSLLRGNGIATLESEAPFAEAKFRYIGGVWFGLLPFYVKLAIKLGIPQEELLRELTPIINQIEHHPEYSLGNPAVKTGAAWSLLSDCAKAELAKLFVRDNAG